MSTEPNANVGVYANMEGLPENNILGPLYEIPPDLWRNLNNIEIQEVNIHESNVLTEEQRLKIEIANMRYHERVVINLKYKIYCGFFYGLIVLLETYVLMLAIPSYVDSCENGCIAGVSCYSIFTLLFISEWLMVISDVIYTNDVPYLQRVLKRYFIMRIFPAFFFSNSVQFAVLIMNVMDSPLKFTKAVYIINLVAHNLLFIWYNGLINKV